MVDRAVVIVALPASGENVHKISSEEKAHLTLLYLGEVDLSEEAILYVQHACAELSPFGLSVDYRGTLGNDDADVLFFEKSAWDLGRVAEFRHHLLLNDEIKRAYDAVEQFPEWTPHLTLGYPEAPAHPEDDRHLSYVGFDRIAVWMGEFDGPEFRLRYDDYMTEVRMSGMTTAEASEKAEAGGQVLADLFHYGVKGMKWGVRKNPDGTTSIDQTRVRKSLLNTNGPVSVTQRTAGTYVKARGGRRQTASEDAIRTQAARQRAKKSTTDALSTKELKDTIERMRLEQEFAKLDRKVSRKGRGILKSILETPAGQQAAEAVVKKVAGTNSN